MGLLDRLRGNLGTLPSPDLSVDTDIRTAQLRRLRATLIDLVDAMVESNQRTLPGWSEKMVEYRTLCGDIADVLNGPIDRVEMVDLAFRVRPVYKNVPEGEERIGELQAQALTIATQLGQPLDSEHV